jgi:hypothetical protein
LENKNAHKRLIYTLIIFTFALVIANVFMSAINPEDNQRKKITTTIQQIDSVVQTVLKSFDINDAWVKKTKVNRRLFDSLAVQHKISLPTDISTVEFIAELNNKLNFNDILLTSSEEKVNGDSEFKIYSAGTLKFWAALLRDSKIKRNKGSFVFLLTEISNLNSKQSEVLFNSPFPFSAVFIPSLKNESLKEMCLSKGKEFSIILNDDKTEDIFKLDPAFGKKRLTNSVINVVKNFGSANIFYIDYESAIYRSTSYNYIEEEFRKRGKKLNVINKLDRLESQSIEDLKSLFDFYHESISETDKKILLTSAENYLLLEPQINLIVKKGYKILSLSKAVF